MNNLPELLSVIVIGLIGGVAVGLQGPMSGVMSARLGPFASSLIIHLGGAIASAVILLFQGGVNLQEVRSLPKPLFLAGLFGVVLYATFAYTIPRVGATVAVALLILAQLSVGLFLDHFGLLGVEPHPVNAPRLFGLALLLAGAYLVTR